MRNQIPNKSQYKINLNPGRGQFSQGSEITSQNQDKDNFRAPKNINESLPERKNSMNHLPAVVVNPASAVKQDPSRSPLQSLNDTGEMNDLLSRL